jgi:hypothetical protein
MNHPFNPGVNKMGVGSHCLECGQLAGHPNHAVGKQPSNYELDVAFKAAQQSESFSNRDEALFELVRLRRKRTTWDDVQEERMRIDIDRYLGFRGVVL